MTHVAEKLDVMDGIASFRKQKDVSISRLSLVLVLVFFVLVVLATGLLTYYLTPAVETVVQNDCVESVTSSLSGEAFSLEETEDILETTQTTTEFFTTTKEAVKPRVNLRLPKSIRPNTYRLYLLPFVFEGNFTFHGNVSVNVTVDESTASITLHADELEIEERSVEVLSEDGRSLKILRCTNDTARNFFVVHLDEKLSAGSSYEVRMKFAGILNDVLQGFYRSSYTVNNTRRWIAVTQFQPTDARKAFPCFDEPAMKARFQINLGRPREMSSISNMPKFKSTPIENLEGYLWDHFEMSVPMSTYLVAFVVSDFESLTKEAVSVWFRKTASNQAAFSLKIAPALLRYYEDYFQIKFPLPKIDMVALPDFSTGAMENWGLITYRESVLLYEPETSTKFNMQIVYIVVAHELAHQWFGNLVSPLWWDDLWLNEGFATFMEYLSVDAVCPELKILDQFVVQELQGVLTLDALKSSHPVSVAVGNPNEINNIFDRISYAKGATIIRMMEHFLTTPVFRTALTDYLNDRKYSNAEQDDLWRFLTEQAHKDRVLEANMTVKAIMDSWTLQTGFPVVKVTRDYERMTVLFQQERFLVAGNSSGSDPTLWWVPITYVSKSNRTEKKGWLRSVPELILDVEVPMEDWILVNVNQTGYYRVDYDQRNWDLLVEQLNTKDGHVEIDPKNRAQLLDDSFNLANGGYLDYAVALNVTRYLVHERESVPWRTAFVTFDYLHNVFSRTGYFDLYRRYVLHLLHGLYEDVGFREKSTDSPLTIQMRSETLLRACRLGYRACIINSINEFQKWRTSPDPDHINPISPNLRGIVYCYGIKAGGQEEWDFAWERYLKTEVATERELLMTGLGCSREPWILRRYLERTVTPGSGIRKHDSIRIFTSITESIIGEHIAYNFLKSDFERIEKYMGSSTTLMAGIIRECISLYPTREELDDIKNFVRIRKKEFAIVGRLIDQLIEKAEANLIWRKTNLDRIITWFSQQEYS